MTKPERLTGLVLENAGVPFPRLIARMLAGEDTPPAPPTATHYLYGRVAADGETPTITVNGVGYYGIVLDKVPEYNEKEYPYIAINYEGFAAPIQVFVSPTPITVRPGYGHVLEITSGMMAEMILEDSGREYWSEWQSPNASTYYFTSRDVIWANHTINTIAGELYVEAGHSPVVSTLPEVLIDCEIKADYANSHRFIYPIMSHFAVGDTARITINGLASEHIVEKPKSHIYWAIGNEALFDESAEDNGGDWAFWVPDDVAYNFYCGHPEIRFYNRLAGTYQIKIEKIAIGKE